MRSYISSKSIPAFATDLDGTLIPLDGNQANLSDLELIKREIAGEQIPLLFVTGRHIESVLAAIDQFQLPFPGWIIGDVGTTIYQRQGDRYPVVQDYQQHLYTITARMPVDELRCRIGSLPGLRLQESVKQGRYKLSYYAERKMLGDLIRQIEQRLVEFSAPYSLIHSLEPGGGEGLIDLLPQGISKAYALDWWTRLVNLDRSQLVFAGDSGNDLAALTAGYRAILVGNADRTLARHVVAEHRARGFSERLYLASSPASSGVWEGLVWYSQSFAHFPSHDSDRYVDDLRTIESHNESKEE